MKPRQPGRITRINPPMPAALGRVIAEAILTSVTHAEPGAADAANHSDARLSIRSTDTVYTRQTDS